MAIERVNFTCFVCKAVVKGSYTKLTAHLKTNHGFKTGSNERRDLICGQNSCTAQMKTFANFRYHLMCCELYSLSPCSSDTSRILRLPNNGRTIPNNIHIDSCPISVLDEGEGQSPVIQFDDKIERAVGKLMLALRTKHNVTNASLNFVSSEIVSILEEKNGNDDLPLSVLIKAFKVLTYIILY